MLAAISPSDDIHGRVQTSNGTKQDPAATGIDMNQVDRGVGEGRCEPSVPDRVQWWMMPTPRR